MVAISKEERKQLISTFKTSEENMRWLVENYDRLKQKYGDSWVAVRQGKVVAHDKDYEHLLKVLEEMQTNADLPTTAIDFISSVPPNFLL
jgi:hypothetical protein